MKSDCAFSVTEALDKIRSADKTGNPFDAIILDWKMAGKNGILLPDAICQGNA